MSGGQNSRSMQLALTGGRRRRRSVGTRRGPRRAFSSAMSSYGLIGGLNRSASASLQSSLVGGDDLRGGDFVGGDDVAGGLGRRMASASASYGLTGGKRRRRSSKRTKRSKKSTRRTRKRRGGDGI